MRAATLRVVETPAAAPDPRTGPRYAAADLPAFPLRPPAAASAERLPPIFIPRIRTRPQRLVGRWFHALASAVVVVTTVAVFICTLAMRAG